MAEAIKKELGRPVNVPADDMPQYAAALGCAILGHISLGKQRQRSGVSRKAA
jgi:activator of 2-hydroxyglutaryl-CoA dehydratase